MGRVLTNTTTLQMATEATLGLKPTSGWLTIEPNSIGKFGPSLKKVTREPISKNRQRRKGALVDLDSAVDFECDITYSHVKMFVEGLFFATAKGFQIFEPTSVTTTGYVVPSSTVLPDNMLILARGFALAANNGLKVTAGTSTNVLVKAAGLAAETVAAGQGAIVEVSGVKLATADGTINASGNLQTTIFNWLTGSQITTGQFVWVGDLAGTANSFAIAANRGLARVTNITATILTFDKKGTTFVADDGSGKDIYVLWGSYIRNVAVGAADYLERTYHLELGYENLQNPGPGDEYEYATGNFINEIVFDFPITNKGTMKVNFIGLTTDAPTVTRATGASTGRACVGTAPVNTSADLIRLRATEYDEDGITTDFKSLSISIKNNVSPEKVLGTLGARYMNAGMFHVDIDAQVLFTDSSILEAMRNNATLTMEVAVRNDDGGFVMDIPSMTIEGGDKEFPINQTVSIAMKTMAFQDDRFGSSVSMSTFPYLPAS